MGLYKENFRNLPVPRHKAQAYQILHVALSSGPLLSIAQGLNLAQPQGLQVLHGLI